MSFGRKSQSKKSKLHHILLNKIEAYKESYSGTWDGYCIGLLDLDAFYASVEQLDHPEWRGKPVIVGGKAGSRGVVAAASYEARKFGVHSAMPSGQATKLCPHAIWTSGRMDRYNELSEKVMDILYQETPFIQQVSIDEAFFDITPDRAHTEDPVDVAKRIQKQVSTLGFTCSIGLSTFRTIAKIASDFEKPNGLTVIPPGFERDFLDPLPIKELSGVGEKTEAKLHTHDIYSIKDLIETDDQTLNNMLGKAGLTLKTRALGEETEPVRPDDTVKSVSNERTFEKDLTTEEEVSAALKYIATLVCRRLRRKNLKGKTISLKVRYRFGSERQTQTTLTHLIDTENELIPVVLKLLKDIWYEGLPVRLLSIGISGFDKSAEQLSLDITQETNNDKKNAKSENLAQITDDLRSKYGDNAVVYGSELRSKDKTTKTASMTKEKA